MIESYKVYISGYHVGHFHYHFFKALCAADRYNRQKMLEGYPELKEFIKGDKESDKKIKKVVKLTDEDRNEYFLTKIRYNKNSLVKWGYISRETGKLYSTKFELSPSGLYEYISVTEHCCQEFQIIKESQLE